MFYVLNHETKSSYQAALRNASLANWKWNIIAQSSDILLTNSDITTMHWYQQSLIKTHQQCISETHQCKKNSWCCWLKLWYLNFNQVAVISRTSKLLDHSATENLDDSLLNLVFSEARAMGSASSKINLAYVP